MAAAGLAAHLVLRHGIVRARDHAERLHRLLSTRLHPDPDAQPAVDDHTPAAGAEAHRANPFDRLVGSWHQAKLHLALQDILADVAEPATRIGSHPPPALHRRRVDLELHPGHRHPRPVDDHAAEAGKARDHDGDLDVLPRVGDVDEPGPHHGSLLAGDTQRMAAERQPAGVERTFFVEVERIAPRKVQGLERHRHTSLVDRLASDPRAGDETDRAHLGHRTSLKLGVGEGPPVGREPGLVDAQPQPSVGARREHREAAVGSGHDRLAHRPARRAEQGELLRAAPHADDLHPATDKAGTGPGVDAAAAQQRQGVRLFHSGPAHEGRAAHLGSGSSPALPMRSTDALRFDHGGCDHRRLRREPRPDRAVEQEPEGQAQDETANDDTAFHGKHSHEPRRNRCRRRHGLRRRVLQDRRA